jgi:excisionase family DNA binding protein
MEPTARAHELSANVEHATESRWWSAKRAAAYIGAGPKEIYKAVRVGKLKAVRLNDRGDIRTTREWVDEWMELKLREQRVM